ncbi:MAG: hypothetical protein K8T90_03530 [Planctomycetes bacterium]|nr:hypothetical protein [Planctomycetota bacterium]
MHTTVLGLCAAAALASPTLHAQSLLAFTTGDSQSDNCGWSVARLGDLDGDGLDDFVVGCPGDGPFTGAHQGRARVCSGKTGVTLFDWRGAAVDDLFGYSVANAGDTDGDGIDEIVVGAPGSDAVASLAGTAYLFSGKDGTLRRSWSGDSKDDLFGWSVAGGGDVDGDGLADVVVGAWRDDKAGTDSGSVYVFSGATGQVIHLLTGTSNSEWFGIAVAGAEDVDGDDRADILIGAFNDSSSLPSAGSALLVSGATGTTLSSFHGTWPGGNLGFSVAGAGDLNADGVPDLIVGAPYESVTAFRSGSAYVYSGADKSLLYEFHGTAPDDYLGEAVSAAGDVNGDGFDDVVVGARLEPDHTGLGAAHVYSGRDGSLLVETFGDVTLSSFGVAVSGGGDMNGDGFDDIVVGSPQASTTAFFEGAAYVYSPCPLPPMVYCTAKQTSQGCLPLITWSGTTALSGADDFELQVWNLIPKQSAFLLLGAAPVATPWHGGTLCVGSPVKRLHAGKTRGNPGLPCAGTLEFAMPQTLFSSLGLVPGSAAYVQLVSRDPGLAPPDALISTAGLRLTICP